MDSLTKRLLLNSGMLNTPQLYTTGIVYPDKTLKKSEIDLYNAKKALKHLEDGIEQLLDGNEINKRTDAVKSAIASLEPSEARYFQRRYIKNSAILQRAMSGRRRADSEAATRAAEARSRAAQERERKTLEDLANERKREVAKEEAYEKEQARLLAEEEKKAKNDAERAALQKKNAERLEKRNLLRQQAEKRRKVYEENAKKEAVAAQRAAEALERNRKKEEDLAEKERLAELAKQQKEKRERELQEKQKEIDQIESDLKIAQELWQKELLNQRLRREREQAQQIAKENERQKARDEQIKSDLAMAQRLRDEEFKRAREAEEELKRQRDAAKRAEHEHNWYNNKGWQKDWIKVDVRGDGDCLFHAVCVAMGNKDQDCHTKLRTQAMDYMEANLDTPWQNERANVGSPPSTWRSTLTDTGPHTLVVGFTEVEARDVNDYIRLMRMRGTWGTDFEIRAIVKVLPKPLNIIMEYPGGVIHSPPDIDGNPDDLHIYHKTPGNHYQAYVHKDRE